MSQLVTIHDFLESVEDNTGIKDGILEILEKNGREEIGKIMCICREFAEEMRIRIQEDIEGYIIDSARSKNPLLNVDSLAGLNAMELILHQVQADCHMCLNSECEFRRRANPVLPKTNREDFYSPPVHLLSFVARPN